MSHRLTPRAGRPFLEPEDVVGRLQEEFAYCDADRDQGAEVVGDMIAKLVELRAPQAILDAAVASRDRAYSVVVADAMTSEDYLSFVVRPGDGLLIGYYSAQHETAVRALLERCARALDYDIYLV